MNYGYTEQIRERVLNAPEDSVFVNSDFADIADGNTIKQSINRLIKEGKLRRIARGVFDKPKYSELLGEYVAANPHMVAMTLARHYHWTIAPYGDAALNLLGLSTQVPAVWSYVSDGPYKTYMLGKTKIQFMHRTNKEITGLSHKTILVIQALKTLGKTYVNDKTIRILSYRLSTEEKETLLKEGVDATEWIYSTIKRICKEGQDFD